MMPSPSKVENVLSPVCRPAVLPKGQQDDIPEEQLEELKAQFVQGVREFEEGGHVYHISR